MYTRRTTSCIILNINLTLTREVAGNKSSFSTISCITSSNGTVISSWSVFCRWSETETTYVWTNEELTCRTTQNLFTDSADQIRNNRCHSCGYWHYITTKWKLGVTALSSKWYLRIRHPILCMSYYWQTCCNKINKNVTKLESTLINLDNLIMTYRTCRTSLRQSLHVRGRPFFSLLSRAYKTYAVGRGSKEDVRFFQNSKMTILFQQNHHFIGFFIRTLLVGGVQKQYVLYARENYEKMDNPQRETVTCD